MTDSNDISDEEIAGLIDMPGALAACRLAFESVGRGQILNPARQFKLEERDGLDYFGLDMPAQWPGTARSRKVIEEYSDVSAGTLAKREAFLEFEDLRSGECLRLDAGEITDLRTGAAGALGVSFLASRPVTKVAIVGTGRVSRNLALACDRLFTLSEVRATSRTPERRDAFAEAIGPRLVASLTTADSLAECVDGVDAVLTAAPTPQPIIDVADLTGVDAIAVIAGDSRTRQVTHDVLRGRRVVVDHYEQARVSGEFRWAREHEREAQIELVRNPAGEVMTLADAACGRLPATGGTAYLTGMAAQDLCMALRIVDTRAAR